MSLLALTLATFMVSGQGGERQLAMKSLRPGCRIVQRWTGVVPAKPYAAWLECGPSPVLLTGPLNLVKQVRIDTAEKALDYVRAFTNADTYQLFEMGGAVEVLPSARTGEPEFNELPAGEFAKHFRPAAVKVIAEKGEPQSHDRLLGVGRQFEVRRTILLPDQTVRAFVEVVWEDGFYSLVSKEILVSDAGSVGLLYFWPQ